MAKEEGKSQMPLVFAHTMSPHEATLRELAADLTKGVTFELVETDRAKDYTNGTGLVAGQTTADNFEALSRYNENLTKIVKARLIE